MYNLKYGWKKIGNFMSSSRDHIGGYMSRYRKKKKKNDVVTIPHTTALTGEYGEWLKMTKHAGLHHLTDDDIKAICGLKKLDKGAKMRIFSTIHKNRSKGDS